MNPEKPLIRPVLRPGREQEDIEDFYDRLGVQPLRLEYGDEDPRDGRGGSNWLFALLTAAVLIGSFLYALW